MILFVKMPKKRIRDLRPSKNITALFCDDGSQVSGVIQKILDNFRTFLTPPPPNDIWNIKFGAF